MCCIYVWPCSLGNYGIAKRKKGFWKLCLFVWCGQEKERESVCGEGDCQIVRWVWLFDKKEFEWVPDMGVGMVCWYYYFTQQKVVWFCFWKIYPQNCDKRGWKKWAVAQSQGKIFGARSMMMGIIILKWLVLWLYIPAVNILNADFIFQFKKTFLLGWWQIQIYLSIILNEVLLPTLYNAMLLTL